MDHVDLYLIHWPVPSQDLFVDTWRAFERIHEEGGARTIGVSNFRVEDLERLEHETETAADGQPDRAAPPLPAGASCAPGTPSTAIATEAWSPLAPGRALGEAEIVDDRRRTREDRRRR